MEFCTFRAHQVQEVLKGRQADKDAGVMPAGMAKEVQQDLSVKRVNQDTRDLQACQETKESGASQDYRVNQELQDKTVPLETTVLRGHKGFLANWLILLYISIPTYVYHILFYYIYIDVCRGQEVLWDLEVFQA